jgi:hypothetical protein
MAESGAFEVPQTAVSHSGGNLIAATCPVSKTSAWLGKEGMPIKEIPDARRCMQITTAGHRCQRERGDYGDKTVCGLHYHHALKVRKAAAAAEARPTGT